MGIPAMLTRIHSIVFSSDGTLWLGAREGVYFTHLLGADTLWAALVVLTARLTLEPVKQGIGNRE